MADIVNLQQSEYDAAIGTLEGLHQQTITAITNLMTGINTLAEGPPKLRRTCPAQ